MRQVSDRHGSYRGKEDMILVADINLFTDLRALVGRLLSSGSEQGYTEQHRMEIQRFWSFSEIDKAEVNKDIEIR